MTARATDLAQVLQEHGYLAVVTGVLCCIVSMLSLGDLYEMRKRARLFASWLRPRTAA